MNSFSNAGGAANQSSLNTSRSATLTQEEEYEDERQRNRSALTRSRESLVSPSANSLSADRRLSVSVNL
jgi:hypothetical protein